MIGHVSEAVTFFRARISAGPAALVNLHTMVHVCNVS